MRASLRGVRRLVPGVLAGVTAALLSLTLAACERCDGVVGCTNSPLRLGVGGQLVDRQATAGAVRGARIEVTRTGGIALTPERATTTTDGTGWWNVAFDAAETGEAVLSVRVTPPPPGLPYQVDGVRVPSEGGRGQGAYLGRWVAEPNITFLGELRERASGSPIAGALVTWERRGGIEVDETPNTGRTVATNGNGYFLIDLRPRSYGTLLVDLVIDRPNGERSLLRNVPIVPAHLYGPALPSIENSFRVGLGLAYGFQVIHRGLREPQSGTLTYTRTGGPTLNVNEVLMYADQQNVYRFDLSPSAPGTVIGDFRFLNAFRPETATFRGVRLETYDSLGTPVVTFRYGEAIRYAGRLLDATTGAPLPATVLRFQRTSGIALVGGDTLRTTTDAAGRFELAPLTTARGEVVGTLTALTAQAARPAGTVRLATFASDSTRSLGDVRVGAVGAVVTAVPAGARP